MNDMTTLSVEHTFEEEASTSPGSRPASVVERERNVLGHEIEEETSFALLESNEDVKDEQTAGHDMAGESKQKRKRTRYAIHYTCRKTRLTSRISFLSGNGIMSSTLHILTIP